MLGPSLHSVSRQAKSAQFAPSYTERLLSVATSLSTSQVPMVFSLMHLAHLTNSSWTSLRDSIKRQSDDYRVFEIRKRSGGNRRICSPNPMLKRVQQWIHSYILKSPGALKRMHHASAAYAPNSSILKNAGMHSGCAWLIKLDIKDFFESISERQVYHVFRSLGYPALLSFELSRICTRVIPPRVDGKTRPRDQKWRWTNDDVHQSHPYAKHSRIGHLPQGAPTSAMLANLVVTQMDHEIQKIADFYGASYSRYADDIVLSLDLNGNKKVCNEIMHTVAYVVTRGGFRVNRVKSHISGPGARKVVTGLVVNDTIPRLTKSMKDKIELALYHIKKHGLLSHASRCHSSNPLGYLNHLTGLIHFARSIDHTFGERSMKQLASALESHSELIQVLRTFDTQTAKSKYCFI